MANSMTGERAPIDWREDGYFEVRFEPGQTVSEEMHRRGGDQPLEVRPELWNDDGGRLSGDELPEVSVDGVTVVLSEAVDHPVVVVARWNDGSAPQLDAQGNPVEGDEPRAEAAKPVMTRSRGRRTAREQPPAPIEQPDNPPSDE